MSDPNVPNDDAPLTPFAYWQESLLAWNEFATRTGKIVMEQVHAMPTDALDEDAAETATDNMLRAFSDYNLRRWQNTARLLDGLPDWMSAPQVMAGSSLVDWFDRMRRGNAAFQYETDASAPANYTEAATPQSVADAAMRQPAVLAVPEGEPDDLTRIKGIGPKLSAMLNEMGVYHFRQIASWEEPEAAWVDEALAFKGRVTREQWISQARALTSNGGATLH